MATASIAWIPVVGASCSAGARCGDTLACTTASSTTTTRRRVRFDVMIVTPSPRSGVTAAEDAATGSGVIELGAAHGVGCAAHVDFGGQQHAERGRYRVEPVRRPLGSRYGGRKCPRGIHAHPRQGCFDGDVGRDERAREE